MLSLPVDDPLEVRLRVQDLLRLLSLLLMRIGDGIEEIIFSGWFVVPIEHLLLR